MAAKTLMETLKGQLGGPQEQAAPELGQTGQAQRLLRAKTGKAVAPTGPRASALQEKIAQQQARAGLEQIEQKGQLAAAQLEQREEDIAQREAQQVQSAQEQLQQLRDQAQRQSDSMLRNFEAQGLRQETAEDVRQLEQLGFNLRLQNEQYVNQLQDAGSRMRLDNDLNFKTQIAKDAFRDQQQLMANDIAFKRMMDVDDREFLTEIANINADQALRVAEQQAKAASAQQVAEGAGKIIQTGVGSETSAGFLSGLFGDDEDKGRP